MSTRWPTRSAIVLLAAYAAIIAAANGASTLYCPLSRSLSTWSSSTVSNRSLGVHFKTVHSAASVLSFTSLGCLDIKSDMAEVPSCSPALSASSLRSSAPDQISRSAATCRSLHLIFTSPCLSRARRAFMSADRDSFSSVWRTTSCSPRRPAACWPSLSQPRLTAPISSGCTGLLPVLPSRAPCPRSARLRLAKGTRDGSNR